MAEQDRGDGNMEAIDEAGLEEIADDRRAITADLNVLAVRHAYGLLERVGRRGVEEMERRTAGHLDGGPRLVRQDEDRAPECGSSPHQPRQSDRRESRGGRTCRHP